MTTEPTREFAIKNAGGELWTLEGANEERAKGEKYETFFDWIMSHPVRTREEYGDRGGEFIVSRRSPDEPWERISDEEQAEIIAAVKDLRRRFFG